MIVDRERAIRDHKPVNHFGARLKLANGGAAEWRTDPWLPEGTLYVLDRALAERVALTCKLK
ncbi:hypothetical protein [Acidihalobacter yilgarnensis]|uniref:hypothetical protein n=1 Tax=Acidihalobacter yilgarnensis TaxID=2819280 RepID=UPI0009F1EE82|nr:hypothetical protein [Acidihalobacter yilgarnensis]